MQERYYAAVNPATVAKPATIGDLRKIVRTCFEKATKLYGTDFSDVEINFKLKGRSAGQAGRWKSGWKVKFNLEAVRKDYNDWLNDTVPHEVAHIVCQKNPSLGRNHNNGWKRVCLSLGGSAKRCHNLELTPGRRVTKYLYKAEFGTEVKVGPRIHKKIQTLGMFYWTSSRRRERFGKEHFVKRVEHG